MRCPTCGGLIVKDAFLNYKSAVQFYRKCINCGRDPDIVPQVRTEDVGKCRVMGIGHNRALGISMDGKVADEETKINMRKFTY